MGVVEDVGNVERLRKHLDTVVDVGDVDDERRDPRACDVRAVGRPHPVRRPVAEIRLLKTPPSTARPA